MGKDTICNQELVRAGATLGIGGPTIINVTTGPIDNLSNFAEPFYGVKVVGRSDL